MTRRWIEVACPPDCEPGARRYMSGRLSVIVGRDPNDGLWHMSIAHQDRLPKWEELRDARYEFIPDAAWVAQVLPPRSEYLNVHKNCLHLWEVPELEGRHASQSGSSF